MFGFRKDPYRRLKRRIGAEQVLDRLEDRMVYAVDASYTAPPGDHDPDVVVLPRTVEQVQEAVRFAREEGLAIVPRGAGTGLSAGSVPLQGGMVIALEKMRRVHELNRNQRWLQCEMGLTTEEVKKAAATHRLYYPPDPSSFRISSIGGNLAENAGGLRCVKYGTTKDYVLGLRYVDDHGDIVETGALASKPPPLDLTPLLVGSEGLFGVLVEARLGLLPKPQATYTLIAHFAETDHAIEAIHTLLAELVPSVLEFMDHRVIGAIRQHDPYPFPEGTAAALLLETDGPRASARSEAARAEEVLKRNAIEVHSAEDESKRERLWQLRRLVSPSLGRLADGKINEDIVVPISAIGECLGAVDRIARDHGISMPVYGHAGDGNLHINAMYEKADPVQREAAEHAILESFQQVISLGGTISGEHGIGAAKAEYLGLQYREDELRMLRGLKQAFDREGLFNPGKVFPETDRNGEQRFQAAKSD